MRSFFSTAALAGASARHPWRTLGLWLLIVVAAGVLAGTGNISAEDDFTNTPDAKRAHELIEARMDGAASLTETIVVQADATTVDDPAFRAVVEDTAARLAAMPDVVANVATYYQAEAAGAPEAEALVSADRRTTILPVTLAGDFEALAERGAEYLTAAQAGAGDGFAVYSVGDLSGAEVYGGIAEEDLGKDLSIGLPVAAVVLVVVFGALVAAGLPILLGLVSIFVATGLTAVASRVVGISDEVSVMITMIGLAVGIDYALFLIERYREERRHGLPKHDAIALAGGTAGKAVLFSGGTVVVALMGMFLIPVTVFHALAVGAILAVLVAVLATQTLVPALLGLLGDKIDWPRTDVYSLRSNTSLGMWGRVTRVVMARPVAALLVAGGALLAVALPALGLRTGMSGMESLPDSSVKRGYEILAQEFYAGETSPVQIVVDAPAADPRVAAGLERLTAALADHGIYGPATTTSNAAGDLTLVSVPLGVDPNSRAAYGAVESLRESTVPAAFGDLAERVYVGGNSAFVADFNAALNRYTPWVFAFVLGASFLLLMLAFRSVVVPLKAIVLNLLSVGAAYGVLVLVFQEGYGAEQLGLIRTESITAWLPVFLFCVLFGLSMDYHVFLLSRIREHFDRTGRNDESVAVGLQATAKIITGAALIMVAVFGAFATGRLADIQQMGFGLAVAVLIDATIVRSVLVPASMKLLGDRNWYLPRWLRWLPDLRIEGAPAAPATRPTAPRPAPEPALAD
ncbi:MAG: MMPL family transporter [Chloroflexota bacterium]|nr:MMPL family transporter [Chloroflexota bacterium]